MRIERWVGLALVFLAGCALPFYVPGDFEETLPRLDAPLEKGAKVWIERPKLALSPYARHLAALLDGFEAAFAHQGAVRPEKKEVADIVVDIDVLSWEYSDMGFSGPRARDDVSLAVRLSDPKKRRILQRAHVHVRSDMRIISKYVESLFAPRR